LIALFTMYPIASGIRYFVKPLLKQEIKPVIEYCLKNKEEEDKIYVYHGAMNAFEYYTFNKNILFLTSENNNQENLQKYLLELDKYQGEGRIWFIFSHVLQGENRIFLVYLDHIGHRIDSFEKSGASVYLYDL